MSMSSLRIKDFIEATKNWKKERKKDENRQTDRVTELKKSILKNIFLIVRALRMPVVLSN